MLLHKIALFLLSVLCLSLVSCAKKETLRRVELEPYEGPVTVEVLKQSVGFGNVRSIKAFADVVILKQGEIQRTLSGVFGYKAPEKLRINLFGPFGMTVTEILISGELLQLSVPPRNVLYEWNSPGVSVAGLMNGPFRYAIAEEGEMYMLSASGSDESNAGVVAEYFFDRTYLLNRASSFFKDGSAVLKAEFNDFNGRVPERTRLSFPNGTVMEIVLREPEFDSDIPDEYFKVIDHGDKQIRSFQEVLQRFIPDR